MTKATFTNFFIIPSYFPQQSLKYQSISQKNGFQKVTSLSVLIISFF